MKNQLYYSVYANKDQVQERATDPELHEFLSHLQVSKSKALLDHITKSFMGLEGNKSRLFFGFKYNDYTNLSKLEAGRRIFVHGMKGVHNLARATSYFDFYVSEEENLKGSRFFDYVFGTEYPSEYEMRTSGSEGIHKVLSDAAESPVENRDNIYISNRSRELVCRIAERLWSSQLEDSTSRLVILLPKEEIYEESVELLKQLYLLLPEQLRLNMGFAVDCGIRDIRNLIVDCDLPVHIFTMRAEDKEQIQSQGEEIKYPLVYFDTTNLEAEPFDAEKLNILEKLSRKLSSSSDAKMAYVEKKVREDGKRMVSFKNLSETFEKMQKDDYFWWDRSDLETLEDVKAAYQEQQELMEDKDLKKEALYSFYAHMLPEKEYAFQVNDRVLKNKKAENDEVLTFFKNNFSYGKIIDAAEDMKKKICLAADQRQKKALSDLDQQWKDKVSVIEQEHQAVLGKKEHQMEAEKEKYHTLETQYQDTLSEHAKTVSTLKEEHTRLMDQEIAQGQEKLSQMEKTWSAKCEQLKEKTQSISRKKEELEQANSSMAREVEQLKRKNEELDGQVMRLSGKGAEAEIQRMSAEKEQMQKKISKMKEEHTQLSSRAKTAKILFIVSTVAAVLFLAGTIGLGILTVTNNNRVKTLKEEMKTLEETATQQEEALKTKDEEIEKLKAEKEAAGVNTFRSTDGQSSQSGSVEAETESTGTASGIVEDENGTEEPTAEGSTGLSGSIASGNPEDSGNGV